MFIKEIDPNNVLIAVDLNEQITSNAIK